MSIHYNPEELGLEQLAELDEPNLSYEFNTFLVVRHLDSGRIFWGQSSGCSCPTPFEEYHFDGPDATNLQEVQLHNWKAFEDEVNSFCSEHWREGRIPQSEKDELLTTVKRALTASKAVTQ